jgi:hypothetical protein
MSPDVRGFISFPRAISGGAAFLSLEARPARPYNCPVECAPRAIGRAGEFSFSGSPVRS